MAIWLSDDEMLTLRAVVERLIPAGDGPNAGPGALQAGAAEYIDGFLGAFLVEPPRIWAGGPTSGRFGGVAAYGDFHSLSALDELSWRTRIEGSQGIPESEPQERDERLQQDAEFTTIVFRHVCEGTYGPPEYGGNKDLCGWAAIDFAGDVQPRGWTDAEVSGP
jgi:hypothetical protein